MKFSLVSILDHRVRDAAGRGLLKHVQDRVLGLQPGSGIRTETEVQPPPLFPYQSVPLAFLATETLTTAMKYAGQPVDISGNEMGAQP